MKKMNYSQHLLNLPKMALFFVSKARTSKQKFYVKVLDNGNVFMYWGAGMAQW